MSKLGLQDKIKSGLYRGKLVSDIVSIKGGIFSMIKDGFMFDDEVLEATGIKRTVRDQKTVISFKHENIDEIDKKVYPKDTASLQQVLNDINKLGKNFSNYDGEPVVDNYKETDDDDDDDHSCIIPIKANNTNIYNDSEDDEDEE